MELDSLRNLAADNADLEGHIVSGERLRLYVLRLLPSAHMERITASKDDEVLMSNEQARLPTMGRDNTPAFGHVLK